MGKHTHTERVSSRLRFFAGAKRRFVFIFLFLSSLFFPLGSLAKVPDTVIVDTSIWNGAVIGEVIDCCEKHDTYLEATVKVSNPKFFWTKILIDNFMHVEIDKVGIYAKFGFLGPVSSIIPWYTDFAGAVYKIRTLDLGQASGSMSSAVLSK